MKKLAFILLGTLLSCAGQETFTNPVLEQGADPWIVKHEGNYYYCCAMDGNIAVSVSDKLHVVNPPRIVWERPRGSWNGECVWAPELHFWQGRWYIIYAAGYSGPPFIHQKTGVLESVGDDAFGPYIDKGMLYTGDDPSDPASNCWAIDMTLLEHRDRLYAIWSGWERPEPNDKTPQLLYIAEMENPWTISSSRVLLSVPDTDYELEGGKLPINEGPQVLKNGDDVFIVYSCGQSWLDTYKLSWLRLRNPDADPLDPASWEKSPAAVFRGNEHAHGVGHASFTTSPDGKQNYIVYHTKRSNEPGWDRDVRIQRFTFGADGRPVFGDPVAPGVELPVPSGS